MAQGQPLAALRRAGQPRPVDPSDRSGSAGRSNEGGGSSDGGAGAGGDGGGRPAAPVGHYPYPKTNYDEPYRSQFHFTAPGGYLNDVNGLWFWNGTYHLTYQSYAYSLAWGDDYVPGVINRDWAHATSTDLVHWVNQGLMLEADVNSAGPLRPGQAVC